MESNYTTRWNRAAAR